MNTTPVQVLDSSDLMQGDDTAVLSLGEHVNVVSCRFEFTGTVSSLVLTLYGSSVTANKANMAIVQDNITFSSSDLTDGFKEFEVETSLIHFYIDVKTLSDTGTTTARAWMKASHY